MMGMIEPISPSMVYKCLWKCRDLELNMLWTRLTLVGTFMALTYAGYGALILKGLDGIKRWEFFNLAAIGASMFGLLFSVLWTATAKGSKAWFERYEAMLSHFQKTYKDLGLFVQVADEDQVLSYLDFNKRSILRQIQPVDSNLFTQHAGAYSVSKIPIVMGQLSIFAWGVLGIVHTFAIWCGQKSLVEFVKSNDLYIAPTLIAVAGLGAWLAALRFGSSALSEK